MNDDGTTLDFDRLNRGIHIAAELMLNEGLRSGEALDRGWRSVGIDPASVPISLKKLPGMHLPGIVERARREGTPVRVGGLVPVPPRAAPTASTSDGSSPEADQDDHRR